MSLHEWLDAWPIAVLMAALLLLFWLVFDDRALREANADRDTLITASRDGDLKTVWDVLAKETVYADYCRDQDGYTPIELAIRNNHHEVVDALLAYGSWPPAVDNDALRLWRENNHPLQLKAAHIEAVIPPCTHTRALRIAYTVYRLEHNE